jgi:hypothetical protein
LANFGAIQEKLSYCLKKIIFLFLIINSTSLESLSETKRVHCFASLDSKPLFVAGGATEVPQTLPACTPTLLSCF